MNLGELQKIVNDGVARWGPEAPIEVEFWTDETTERLWGDVIHDAKILNENWGPVLLVSNRRIME